MDVSYIQTWLPCARERIATHATGRNKPAYFHVYMYNYHYMPSHTGLKLNEKNILNVLHEARFADGHWELLGQCLITRSALLTIRASRFGEANFCMIDTIVQWLRTDLEASWEKLAEAVARVEEYGEVTADIVRYTGMLIPIFCVKFNVVL